MRTTFDSLSNRNVPQSTLGGIAGAEEPNVRQIVELLKGKDDDSLFRYADQTREQVFGNEVHLRGIIEFSNHCVQNCFYCGLRRDNQALERYRLSVEEIVETSGQAARMGVKTLVLQSGEDPYYSGTILADIIQRLKKELNVAITMSVGERTKEDYRLMRKAGADRYLLKHETADPKLFARLRPGTSLDGRLERLGWLKELGFQVGSGNMVGLPGQTITSLAEDILLMKRLDVEMAGIGPFIPHPNTPLSASAQGTVEMTLRVLALARLAMPFAHLPATTALGSIHPQGRQLALQLGANVVMPNLTPVQYRKLYEIYPNKICVAERSTQCVPCISGIIEQMGKSVSQGFGDTPKTWFTRKALKDGYEQTRTGTP